MTKKVLSSKQHDGRGAHLAFVRPSLLTAAKSELTKALALDPLDRESLVRFAYLVCGDSDVAQDAVQATLTKLLTRRVDLTEVHNPRAYARTAVLNVGGA